MEVSKCLKEASKSNKTRLGKRKPILIGVLLTALAGSLFLYWTSIKKYSYERITESNTTYLGNFLDKASVFQTDESNKIEYATYIDSQWIFPTLSSRWSAVYARAFTIGSENYNGIYLHPYEAGLRGITFKNINIGKKIALFYGLDDRRNNRGGSIKIILRVGEDVVSEIVHDGDDGWREAVIDTKKYNGQQDEITISVTTEAQHGRHLCLKPYIIYE